MAPQSPLALLACPACHGPLRDAAPSQAVECVACAARYGVEGGIFVLLSADWLRGRDDVSLSVTKWNDEYSSKPVDAIDRELATYREHAAYVLPHLRAGGGRPLAGAERPVFLEIGAGQCFMSLLMAEQGYETISLDTSLAALRLGREAFRRRGLDGIFVCGDMTALPVRDQTVSLSYGGGVIEHLENTAAVVRELARVTAKRGYAFNTVPALSLFSMSYCQQWGNVPDIPGLRPVMTFLHSRLLGGRHMKYGFELSFSEKKMRRLFQDAGFGRVETGLFEFGQEHWHMPLARVRAKVRAPGRWFLYPAVGLYNCYWYVYRWRTFWNVMFVRAWR